MRAAKPQVKWFELAPCCAPLIFADVLSFQCSEISIPQ